jgi:hypothetical protein
MVSETSSAGNCESATRTGSPIAAACSVPVTSGEVICDDFLCARVVVNVTIHICTAENDLLDETSECAFRVLPPAQCWGCTCVYCTVSDEPMTYQ